MNESAKMIGGVVLALLGVLLTQPALAQPPERANFYIQVFALSGPVCPVVRPDANCADVLLPGAALLLQRLHRRSNSWRDVMRFQTNRQGYASLLVHRRGHYRITVPALEPSPFPRPMVYPAFEGDVLFNVPARHFGSTNFANVTPVVALFDSGIR